MMDMRTPEQPVEQCLVAVLQSGQTDVALKRIALAVQVLQFEIDLLGEGGDATG